MKNLFALLLLCSLNLLTCYLTAQTSVNLPMSGAGTTITALSGTLYDHGGSTGNYDNAVDGWVYLNPGASCGITLTFTSIAMESCCDHIYIYEGSYPDQVTTPSYQFNAIDGANGGVLVFDGPITIRMTSDGSVIDAGFEMTWSSEVATPDTDFTISDLTAPFNYPVYFTVTGNEPSSLIWDFGDGTSSTEFNPSHVYTAPGTYTITYTATGCMGEVATNSQTLTVQDPPEADVTPLSITEVAPYGNIITNQMTICNNGTGEMIWSINQPLVEDKGLQVLALVNGADASPTAEYAKTIAAINAYFTDYTLTPLVTYDAAVLAAALEDKDVLLIPEQEDCNETAFAAFAPILQNFASNGGTIVVLGSAAPENTGSCLFSMGLFSGSYEGSESGSTTEIMLPEDPLLDGVVGNYVAQVVTVMYDITNTDYVSVVELNGNHVIGYRPIGEGRVVLIGHDYAFSNSNMKRVISNAVSQASNLSDGQWLFLSENEGTLAAGECATIDVQFDGEIVYGGYYQEDMVIHTNDADESEIVVPCIFDIQGTPSFSVSPASFTFAPLMVGDTAIQTMTVGNAGTDSLYIYSITSSNADISTNISTFAVYGGGTQQEVQVLFTPTAITTYSVVLTISTNLGQFIVTVQAEGLGAPTASAVPNPINVTLNSGETQVVPVTIANNGQGPMTYNIDDEAFNGSLPVLIYALNMDPTSVSYLTNLISTTYPNADITQSNASTSAQLAAQLAQNKVFVVPTTFDFNAITTFSNFSNVLEDFVNGGGIVVFAQDFNGILAASGLFNASTAFSSGQVINIVEEHPITEGVSDFLPFNGATPANFSDTDINILALQAPDGFGGGGTVAAYRSIGSGYAVYLGFPYNFADQNTDQLMTNTIHWAVDETLVLWLDLSATGGNLGFPEQNTVNVTLDATGLLGGVYTTEVVIHTNDPLNETITIPVTMTVIGVPLIEVDQTPIDFGSVIIGNTESISITISNPGTDDLNISSISSNLPEFTTSISSATIDPFDEIEVVITFDPTAIQNYNGTLSINNNVNNISIPITGIGQGAPAAAVTPGSLTQTLLAGNQATVPVTLSNSGAGSMQWEVLGAGATDVLMFNIDVDINSLSYTGLLDNIAAYIANANITPFAETDPSALETALVGKELVIVPTQTFTSNPGLLSQMGDVLEQYTNEGGQVLFVGNSCSQCVTSLGLFSGFFSYSLLGNPGDEITFIDANSPFAQEIGATMTLPPISYIWAFNNSDIVNVANGPFGNTAIAYRNIGEGRVTYIPNDFSTLGDETLGQLVINSFDFTTNALPSWLSVTPTSGTTPNPGTVTLNVTFNSNDMLAGTYTHTILVETNDPANPIIELPVTFHVQAFPQANFSPSSELSCDGMVQFTDETLNNPTSWTWSFGDGTSSTEQNPVHSYEEAGTYTVSLNACNNLGCDETVLTDLITVNFDFVYCDTITMQNSGQQSLVSCHGVIRDPGGQGQYPNGILSSVSLNPIGASKIMLHFSSLQVETCCDGVRIYDGPDTGSPLIGQYMTLPNGNGEVESTGGSITIEFFSDGSVVGDGFEATYDCVQITDVPEPAIESEVIDACQGSVQFTDETDNFPDSWIWTFGDGTTSTEQNPLHSYTQSGTYEVTLQACNFLGCKTDTFSVNVEGILNINFGWQNGNPDGPPYVNINSPILFQDQTEGAVDWEWDFGNGNGAQGISSPISFYNAYGIYEVSLTVTTANGCERTITKTIIVVTTGIDTPTLNEANLQLVPNPTNAQVQVSLQLPKADQVNLRVFDAIGKQVFEHKQTTTVQQYQHQLNFADMPRGMYFVTLQTSEGTITRQLSVQ